MVSIDQLVQIIARMAGLEGLEIERADGPQGFRGRNSDNLLHLATTGFAPGSPLEEGLVPTYAWIEEQVLSSGLIEQRA